MHTDDDVTRRVRSWLREDGHESADRVLDDVLPMLDSNTQRVSPWPLRRIAQMSGLTRLAFGAAAAIVVAAFGVNLLPSFEGVGRPAATASTSPSPSPAAQGTLDADPWRPIAAGSHVIATPQMRIHLTMPAGWNGDETGIGLFPGRWIGALDLVAASADISYVVTDVCADEAEVNLAPVGPTVEDLATALANQAGIQRSGPTDVLLGGYPAKRLVLTLLSACPMRDGIWADASRTYGFGLRHGETATVHVVDVNGDRLVIWSAYMNGASAEHIAQLEAITASIEIQPVPNAGPLPDVGTGGWMPIGRHALTVDGLPLSFSVPALSLDRGWARYRDIYISKDTVGSQGAEAAIYWTAFPDGTATDPCASLLPLPSDASAADLAAAVSTALGTELVSGPSDATVGGRPAKHVVVKVREDLGCDPGYLFTWDAALGGPAWWTTDVGDTIRVWIVDVNGKLFVIVGESTPDASAKLEQEIQDIVDTIEFETQRAGVTVSPEPPNVRVRHSLDVDGVRFSVGTRLWSLRGVTPDTAPGVLDGLYASQDITGPQDAEAVIYWTRFPDGAHADPCATLLNLPVDASAVDVAAAVSRAPGTELVTGPTSVTVGGRPASYVVLTVREDLGCDPGYFFTWPESVGGEFWRGTDVGDTIRVWIVDVDGTRLFIGGETHWDGARLEEQLQQIVDSIEFE